MTISWTSFELTTPPNTGPCSELSLSAAKENLDWYLANAPRLIGQAQTWLSGHNLVLDWEESSLRRLSDFILDNAEPEDERLLSEPRFESA